VPGLVGSVSSVRAGAQAMISDSFPLSIEPSHRHLRSGMLLGGAAGRRWRIMGDVRLAICFLMVGAIGIIPGLSAFS